MTKHLWRKGTVEAWCVDASQEAEREGWRTTVGVEDALRHAGRCRLHVLAPVGQKVVLNVVSCHCEHGESPA